MFSNDLCKDSEWFRFSSNKQSIPSSQLKNTTAANSAFVLHLANDASFIFVSLTDSRISLLFYNCPLQESAYDAYYRLSDPRGQIQSYVFDVVRSTVPRMELDEAFASKKEIADATSQQLKAVMQDYGYEILNSLVTDLSPDARVKASMNEINASKRLKEAASHKAEADKVQQVKAAEADAEARYLSGLGVARQRKAIVAGLQASISEFSETVDGVSSKDVMDILVLTQYFDTLAAVGANNLILEHEPASVAMLQQQVNRTMGKNRTKGVFG